MKLFKIWQDVNTDWDTYDSAVVCAKTAKEAQGISPAGTETFSDNWCEKKESVLVEYLGEAPKGMKKGVIVASFNAG